MSTVRACYLLCDHCGTRSRAVTKLPSGIRGEGAARRLAADDGWTRPCGNGRSQIRIDVCPGCSEGKTA